MNGVFGKVLRIVGIIFFALTTLMNLLGGVGTSCAAFLTDQYPNYQALNDEGMQWLYQGLVVATVLLGLMGLWVVVALLRGKTDAFRNALIVLAIGTILAGIQYYFSQQLFGKAAPANMKFYINLITLILFLIYLIPGIRRVVNYSKVEKGNNRDAAGGLVAITMGVVLLSTPIWAGPSHTFQGENWVDLLQTELYLSGVLLSGAGIALLAWPVINFVFQEFAVLRIGVSKDR